MAVWSRKHQLLARLCCYKSPKIIKKNNEMIFFLKCCLSFRNTFSPQALRENIVALKTFFRNYQTETSALKTAHHGVASTKMHFSHKSRWSQPVRLITSKKLIMLTFSIFTLFSVHHRLTVKCYCISISGH